MLANRKVIGDWLVPALAWIVFVGIVGSLIGAALAAR